jgi:hypothetical protein
VYYVPPEEEGGVILEQQCFPLEAFLVNGIGLKAILSRDIFGPSQRISRRLRDYALRRWEPLSPRALLNLTLITFTNKAP